MNTPPLPHALPANSTVGILGGGQLGRMATLAAANLGYRCHIFTPEENSPASQVAAKTTVAGFDDMAALKAFAQQVDVVTLEFENVPVTAVETIAAITPVFPNAEALRIAQHRAVEKQAADDFLLSTVPWQRVVSPVQLEEALDLMGYPAVIKTARLGYDGKGQIVIREGDDLEQVWRALNTDEAILESFIDLMAEISVIVCRDQRGNTRAYPPGANHHENQILATTKVPALIDPLLENQAIEQATKLADALGYIGVLGVEFFIGADRQLYFNEMAPRPHNSGHWTMDAAVTSQFEQQIRAVAGLPLGPVTQRCQVIMENLLGDTPDRIATALKDAEAKLHLYGKAEARPGRKMGHINWLNRSSLPNKL